MPFTYDYERMQTTVDLVLFDRAAPPRILLVLRGREPHKGRWALPGGHVGQWELFADAARREAEEETGVRVEAVTFVGYYDAPDRDPSDRTITLGFWAEIDPEAQAIAAADDAVETRWFPENALPENMAFDHALIARDAIKAREKRL